MATCCRRCCPQSAPAMKTAAQKGNTEQRTGAASGGNRKPVAGTLGSPNSSFDHSHHRLQVPLKYANRSVTGLEYLVSFGVGAALVTAAAAAAYSVAAARLGW